MVRQLALGQSAIVDDVIVDNQAMLWHEIASQFSARLFFVECICSDAAVHRARIEGRTRGIPGWHEVGWTHVERMRAEMPRLTADRLTVDAMQPVEDNIRRVVDYISA